MTTKCQHIVPFLIFWSYPPAAGLIFCTILAKLLAVRINLLWILFALGLLIHAGSWSRKHEKKVNADYVTIINLIDYRLSNNPSIKSQVKAICHYGQGICYWFPFLSHSLPVILLSVSYFRLLQKQVIFFSTHLKRAIVPKSKQKNTLKSPFTPFSFYYDFGFGFFSTAHKLDILVQYFMILNSNFL